MLPCLTDTIFRAFFASYIARRDIPAPAKLVSTVSEVAGPFSNSDSNNSAARSIAVSTLGAVGAAVNVILSFIVNPKGSGFLVRLLLITDKRLVSLSLVSGVSIAQIIRAYCMVLIPRKRSGYFVCIK